MPGLRENRSVLLKRSYRAPAMSAGLPERPNHFDQALAAGLFEGPLREAIHVFKYRPLRAAG